MTRLNRSSSRTDSVSADVRELDVVRLRVAIRGSSTQERPIKKAARRAAISKSAVDRGGEVGNLFASVDAARSLDAQVGDRLIVATDVETVAADVIAVDGGALELKLLAPFDGKPETVTLRPSMASTNGAKR